MYLVKFVHMHGKQSGSGKRVININTKSSEQSSGSSYHYHSKCSGPWNALVHDNPVVPDFIIEKPSTDASPQSSEIEKPSSDATTKEVKEKCDECIFEVNFKIDLKTHKKKRT